MEGATRLSYSNGNCYAVHWRWRGYYDCVDVERFATSVVQPYGVDKKDAKGKSIFKYERVDHCQFVNADPRQMSYG